MVSTDDGECGDDGCGVADIGLMFIYNTTYFFTHPILSTTTFAKGSPARQGFANRQGFAKHIGHFLKLLQISGHYWLLKTTDTSDC